MLAAQHTPVRDADDSFESLGMPACVAGLYRKALGRSAGLILLAGPPGSGKTATLDASRAFVRDALPIDIHSAETAELAVEAALDGRLVIATLELDGAISAILRLRTLVSEPFLLAASLRAAIAQRLVRRLCPACREPVQAIGSQAALLGFDSGAVVWRAPGCDACAGSGCGGRTAVFEGLKVDGDMRRLIVGGDEAVIAGQAFRKSPNLAAAARALVQSGVIAAEEAVRVSRGA
jgi:general secretion pathway protein E